MKTNHQKSNWLFDALLFTGFLVSFFLDLTGLSLHQWLGILGGLLAVYHLGLHWDWVEAVIARFFGRTSGRARIYFLLDLAILFGFYLIVLNGLVISTWLDLPLTNYSAWKDFHVTTSIVTLALVVVKIGLHWRWIVRVARTPLFAPLPQAARVVKPAPAVPGAMTRRDFLKLMGVVSMASLIAIRSAVDNDQVAQAASQTTDGSLATGSTGVSTQTGTTSTSGDITNSNTVVATEAVPASPVQSPVIAQSQNVSTCVVRCDKRCSYPGRCRRYQDGNGNNLCDLGECL